MKQKLLFGVGLMALSFVLYFFKLPGSYNFDSDFARDLINIHTISQGHLTLLGPKSSFGGLYTGPYYYYLFVPIYRISHSLNAILFFNALLFACSISLVFFILNKHLSLFRATLASLALAFLPLLITTSRSPGNAFSYIPFLIVALTIFSFAIPEKNLLIFCLGLLLGIILNFHYSNIFFIVSAWMILLLTLKKRMKIAYFALGIFVSYLPLGLFELKHGLVMFKNTFVNGSYHTFLNDQNGIQLHAKKNIIDNFLFLSEQFRQVIILPPLVWVAIGLVLMLYKKAQERISAPQKNLFIFSILSSVALVFILNGQFAIFYIYPVAIMLALSVVLLVASSKLWYSLIAIILLELLFFPSSLYKPAVRSYKIFQDASNYLVDKKLIDKNNSFNTIQIRKETSIAPYGFEYRYFLIERGYIPADVTEYQQSHTLILFSEVKKLDLVSLNSWEINQFGKENLQKYNRYNFKNLTIYKFEK